MVADFVRRENIRRFERILDAETDAARRAVIEGLLQEELAKARPQEPSSIEMLDIGRTSG